MKQQMNNQTKQEKTQQRHGNDQLREIMNDKLQFEFEPPTHTHFDCNTLKTCYKFIWNRFVQTFILINDYPIASEKFYLSLRVFILVQKLETADVPSYPGSTDVKYHQCYM